MHKENKHTWLNIKLLLYQNTNAISFNHAVIVKIVLICTTCFIRQVCRTIENAAVVILGIRLISQSSTHNAFATFSRLNRLTEYFDIFPQLSYKFIFVSFCSSIFCQNECVFEVMWKEKIQQQGRTPNCFYLIIFVLQVKYAYSYYAAWIEVTEQSACCILRASLKDGQLVLLRNQRLERPCCIKEKKCSDVFDGSLCTA